MPQGATDPLRFGDRMSDFEALMWDLEQSDPSLLSTMTLVAVFDRPLDRAAFRRKLESLTRHVPRLRDRVEAGPLPMVPPVWRPDERFAVDNHVSRQSIGGGGRDELLRVAESCVAAPFEPSRPPWHITLVEDMSGDREALVARLHHSYTDGQGAVRIAMELFDLEPRPAATGPLPPLPPVEAPPLLGRMLADLRHEAARTADAARSLLPWAAGVLREAIAEPGRVTAPAGEMARSLAELARTAAAPGSSLLRPRGDGVRLGEILLNLDDLHRAAKGAGGKVNDAFLAGILGGLAAYHRVHGDASEAVRLGIPVSTRSDGTDMRNQLQGILLSGPLGTAGPAERIGAIHEAVSATRGQPWLALIEQGASAALRLPLAREILALAVRSADVLASNLPGPPVPLYLAGAGVESLVPVGPRAGAALNLTLLSYNGSVGIGVNSDPVSVPDLDVLIGCIEASFAELVGCVN